MTDTTCSCEGRPTYPCDGHGPCVDPTELPAKRIVTDVAVYCDYCAHDVGIDDTHCFECGKELM